MNVTYIPAFLFLAILIPHSKAYAERFCLEASCFEKTPNTQKETDVENRYLALVTYISEDPMKVVQFTGELADKSKNPTRSMQKYFGWIKPESLDYIILGESTSAVLLKNSNGNRFVLYYNHQLKKFEMNYDTPKEFTAIDNLWVNSNTKPTITY